MVKRRGDKIDASPLAMTSPPHDLLSAPPENNYSAPPVPCTNLAGIGLELLEKDALGGDFAQHLTVGGARHAKANGARGAVARQTNDTDVVAKVLA